MHIIPLLIMEIRPYALLSSGSARVLAFLFKTFYFELTESGCDAPKNTMYSLGPGVRNREVNAVGI